MLLEKNCQTKFKSLGCDLIFRKTQIIAGLFSQIVLINHMILQHSLKLSSCSLRALIMKTSLTGLNEIFLMLLQLFGSMFLVVILFSLNMRWDYLLRALLCLAACSSYLWQFSLSYSCRNILSMEGLLSFDIVFFYKIY